ncbi:MAG: hypothetical protein HYT40_01735, partial [Candidatus Sungbacteria bacterium]|nr:hypothetical protein [Candidatus Sungbacteria bacterium]
SLTSAITPQALGASSTAVSIDGVPVPDPAGVGINFSLFPAALVEAVEYHSPFYPAMDATSVILPAPGGRINLRTQGARIGTGAEESGGRRDLSASLLAGSANTLEAAAVYRGGRDGADWVIGGGGLSTRGDFPFRDPVSGARRVRENNDAAGAGGLARYRKRVGPAGSVEFTALSSRLDRTNPGPLDFPSRDHERDTFHLLGASYHDAQAFSPEAGAFAKLAGTLSRVQNEISPSLRTDAHTFGGYAQAGTAWRHGSGESFFALDDLEERLNDGTGLYARNTAGFTHSTAFRAGDFRLIPLLDTCHPAYRAAASLSPLLEYYQ